MQKNVSRLPLALTLLAIVFIIAGCKQAATPSPTSNTDQPAAADNSGGAMVEKASAVITGLNNSGQNGTLKIFDAQGKTKVTLEVTAGPSGVAQPAHFHAGSCIKRGQIVYNLNNVVNGNSETMLDVPVATILSQSLAVIVHKSEADIASYVACGDVTASGQQ